jgi:hypothetical protein
VRLLANALAVGILTGSLCSRTSRIACQYENATSRDSRQAGLDINGFYGRTRTSWHPKVDIIAASSPASGSVSSSVDAWTQTTRFCKSLVLLAEVRETSGTTHTLSKQPRLSGCSRTEHEADAESA